VRDGETGYLVPHGDVTALTDRVLTLANDPHRVETLGAAGRRFAEGLTWDRAAEETGRHLERIRSPLGGEKR
jgi:glycosyltransferase involved in cell wall biosynthesis